MWHCQLIGTSTLADGSHVLQPVLDKRTNLVQAVLVAADKCSTDATSSVFQDARFTPSDR